MKDAFDAPSTASSPFTLAASSGFGGAAGSSGTSGTAGSSGSTGTSGSAGSSGTSGQDGAKGQQCAQGVTGPVGPDGGGGSSGTSGSSGTAGSSGTSGQDGNFGGASFRYLFNSSSTLPSDPGDGKFKLNEAVQNTATRLYVDYQDADDDPSWITLDEIVGMSLVSIASPSKLLPLIAGFIVFRLSDILKQPKFVKDLENYPGRGR